MRHVVSPITMNQKMKNRVDEVFYLQKINLVWAWCSLIYGTITTLPFLFILASDSEVAKIFILPSLLSIIGDVIAIILIQKLRTKIKHRTDFTYCVVAIVLSSLLLSLFGLLIGLISLIMFCSKPARNIFYNQSNESTLKPPVEPVDV